MHSFLSWTVSTNIMEFELSNAATLAIGGIVLAILLLIKDGFQNHGKIIPGPTGIPYIGNFLTLIKENPIDVVQQWTAKYGSVFKFHAMGVTKVIAAGEQALQQMLVTKTNDFAGRPWMFRWRIMLQNSEQISGSDYNPAWVVRKKAFINTLRMCGERLSLLEKITQDFIQDMVDDLVKTGGEAFDIKENIHQAISNIMASIVCIC